MLDEYGLVICGWSADHDTALQDAITRCPTRRFQTFWAARGELAAPAKQLFDHRRAQLLPITDAESFFVDLAAKVASLAELRAGHPASTDVAIATLKRYLADDVHRIRLHDMLVDELGRLEDSVSARNFPTEGDPPNRETFRGRLARYETGCGTLIALMATLGYWVTPHQRPLLTAALGRLADSEAELGSGHGIWLTLRNYPALLTLYASGLAALARGELGTLAAILGDVEVLKFGTPTPLVYLLAPNHVVERQLLDEPGGTTYYTPVQDRLHAVLRDPLRDLIANDKTYDEIFDHFEVLLATACADSTRARGAGAWSPPGRYAWRRHHGGTALTWAREQIYVHESAWEFLSGTLFDGQTDRYREALQSVEKQANELPWW